MSLKIGRGKCGLLSSYLGTTRQGLNSYLFLGSVSAMGNDQVGSNCTYHEPAQEIEAGYKEMVGSVVGHAGNIWGVQDSNDCDSRHGEI